MTKNLDNEKSIKNKKDNAKLLRLKRLEKQLKANILKRKKVKKNNG